MGCAYHDKCAYACWIHPCIRAHITHNIQQNLMVLNLALVNLWTAVVARHHLWGRCGYLFQHCGRTSHQESFSFELFWSSCFWVVVNVLYTRPACKPVERVVLLWWTEEWKLIIATLRGRFLVWRSEVWGPGLQRAGNSRLKRLKKKSAYMFMYASLLYLTENVVNCCARLS